MSTIVHATFHATTLSAVMGIACSTVTHKHASSSGGLEHIVNAFNPEGAAFFVVPGADIMSNTFGLRPCHVIQVIWMILCRPEVRFAPDKDDRNDGSTNGPHFFNPLQIAGGVSDSRIRGLS